MTVSTTTRKAGPFIGNGVTTAFPFSFKVFAKTDLSVILTDAAGAEIVLTLDADYFVALNADQDNDPGGVVTYSYGGAMPSTQKLTILSDVPLLQPTDIQNRGGFYPSVIEDALDRVTILSQQVKELLGRAIRFAASDPATVAELPTVAARRNKAIVFDEDGNIAVSEAGWQVDVTHGNVIRTTHVKGVNFVAGGTTLFLPSDGFIKENVHILFAGTGYGVELQQTAFTLNGATITLVDPIPVDVEQIETWYIQPLAVGSINDGVVTDEKVAANAAIDANKLNFVQAGAGAVARSVRAKLRDAISVKDYGAVGDGVTDDLAAVQACINASVGSTAVITGICGISAPLEIKNGVNVLCLGEIKALPGFVGAQLVTTDTVASYKTGTVDKLRLNGNGLNIKGLVVRQAQTSFINDPYVYGCLNDGIHVQSGYEVFINNWQVLGAASGMTANAAGLRATAGDCHYSDGVATLYPIGVAAEGGNCRFTRVHPWGVYTAGSTPMLHGFLITGEGNTFTDCSPDSPDLANRAIAASKANGGYGFYIDAGAISTKLSGCKLIVASHVNAPAAKLYYAYVGAAFCGFVNGTVDDNSGAAMVAGYMQYVSTTTQRTTEFFGGPLSTGKLWTDGLYSTFTPELRFGGVEISTLGGTYFAGRRSGYAFRIGPMMYFVIHIRLTAKGTATGAVTVGGLPLQYVDFGNSQAWPLNGQIVNPFKNALARIYVASSELRLYDATSGNQLTDVDIGANQEIHISGMYPVATAP